LPSNSGYQQAFKLLLNRKLLTVSQYRKLSTVPKYIGNALGNDFGGNYILLHSVLH